jgi:protein tyrosine phosphatase
MIACQGPQSNTQDATWRLVLQEQVGLIITLAHHIGGYDADCVQYFPQKQGEVLTSENTTVTCMNVVEQKFVHSRSLLVKHRHSGKE